MVAYSMKTVVTKYVIGIDARLWSETGVGRYIRNLVKELARLDQKNEYVLFFRKEQFQSVTLPGKNFKKVLADIPWHSLEEQFALTKILQKEKLDLLHFPYFSVPINYNLPFVVTIHDLIMHNFSTGKASTLPKPLYVLKQFAYRFVVMHAARHAKKILTVSHATQDEIERLLLIPENKIVVTYEGVDQTIQEQKQVKNLFGKYFLFVGNAYPHKNVERLLEAFKIFIKSNKEVQLLLVGKEGHFYERIMRKIVALELDTQVKILRNVNDVELSNLYSHAQALLIPSLMEGFGLPGLEAMSHNCLVLSSDIPALSEIYQSAAIYVNPLSTSDIAEKLEKIYNLTSKQKEELQKLGKKQASKFSWSAMAAQTFKVYESCISVR